MQRKKLLLVTNSYPEVGSKEKGFIHPELLELVRSGFSVTLMPVRFNGFVDPEIPADVIVSSVLADSYKKLQPFTMLGLFFRREFWLELIRRPSQILRFRFWKDSLRAVISEKIFRGHAETYDVYYTYWFSGETTGLVFSDISPIVTRAHGYDLYIERSENAGWIPYRIGNLLKIRNVILLSGKACDYLARIYGFPAAKALISPLGVEVRKPVPFSFDSLNKEVVFFSCSFPAIVKRLPLILDFVIKYALCHPGLRIRWVHMGAKLSDVLRDGECVEFPSNLSVDMRGSQSNKNVLDYMESDNIAFFVNLSEMEGVPVSIMEAQSLGIPAIATDVGCVSDLLEEGGGLLVSADIDTSELVSIVSSVLNDRNRYMKMREDAIQTQRCKYDGKKNHEELAKVLYAVAS